MMKLLRLLNLTPIRRILSTALRRLEFTATKDQSLALIFGVLLSLLVALPSSAAEKRSDRWRYIRYADGTEELYDHQTDPHEWTNLATAPKLKAVIEAHQKWLPASEAKQVGDLKR